MDRRDVNYIAVHASATPPSMDIGVEEIRRWHKDRGWSDVGYHIVVRRDGNIEYGRNFSTPGAHVKGYNRQSIGVCLVGGIDSEGNSEDNFTGAQFNALRDILIALLILFPQARVRGHRDFPNVHKDCPVMDIEGFCSTYGLPYAKKGEEV